MFCGCKRSFKFTLKKFKINGFVDEKIGFEGFYMKLEFYRFKFNDFVDRSIGESSFQI